MTDTANTQPSFTYNLKESRTATYTTLQITQNLMQQLISMFTNPAIIQAVIQQLGSDKIFRGSNRLEWSGIQNQVKRMQQKYGSLMQVDSFSIFKKEPLEKSSEFIEQALIACLKILARINKVNPDLIKIDDYLRSLDQFYGTKGRKYAAKENVKWLYNLYIKRN